MIGNSSNKAHSRVRPLCVLFAMLLIQAASVSVFAQDKPKAGDLIQGVVTDSVSPLMAVYITELDSSDRAVEYAYTDLKGEFSFSLVNPKDRIQFSYYRKEKTVLPIDKAYFEIRMEDDKDLPSVSWEDFAPLDSRELQDIKEIAGWNHLDISINTTDPGIPRTIHTNRGPVIQHEYVDLGLSVKWATCNVGADKPENAGDHYAWGEVETKDEYTWNNYKFNHLGELSKYNSDDKKTSLDPEDDVAHVKWGGSWRMPTHEEFVELSENCTWTWYKSGNSEFGGVAGFKVTGKREGYTDRFIFLPASGSYSGTGVYVGDFGDYWSSSINKSVLRDASYLYFGSSANPYTHLCYRRFYGFSVRPVCP